MGDSMTPATLARRIRVANGTEPGDLLLTGGRVVNVFTGSVETADVVVADGWIAGIGPYDWQAADRIELDGRTVIPGLIDAHMHVESTLLVPPHLATIVVPHGTSTLIADPHEIANVMGVAGVELLIDASAGLGLDIFYMAPSCVPAMPWEHAGAILDADGIERLLANPAVLGLAEMMNFPGVIGGDPDVMAKIATAACHGAIIDGHAPGVTGRDLLAYAAAGIRSDHECTSADEAAARGALGMLVQVREGSIARNLDTMLPRILDDTLGDWCLCTDDVDADELLENGHINGLLKRVVAAGVDPVRAVRHATLVPARHYGLTDRGAVVPGRRADLVVVDDLDDFRATVVVKDGVVVARDGRYMQTLRGDRIPFTNTVHLGAMDESSFTLSLSTPRATVIRIVAEQIVTRREQLSVKISDGAWCFDPDIDAALIASIERHNATGSIGLGLVSGFGFRRHGAIGSSVAHDSHNVIIAGTNAPDMLACARAIEDAGGGFVAVSGGTRRALLPLPVAGLLATEPAEDVSRKLQAANAAAAELGCPLATPFGTLSFLALSVIPELRITDQGLFDVTRQEFAVVAG
jgi:adenine deaminase